MSASATCRHFSNENVPKAVFSYFAGVAVAAIFFNPSYKELTSFLMVVGGILVVPFLFIFFLASHVKSNASPTAWFRLASAMDLSGAVIWLFFLALLLNGGIFLRSLKIYDIYSVFFYFPLITTVVASLLYRIRWSGNC